MTREEAIQAMKEGKHVTHAYFSKDEWVTMEKVFNEWLMFTEDGYSTSEEVFWKYRTGFGWDVNWSIHWTSNLEHINISNVNDVLFAGHKITHDDLKYDWIKLADNGNILCSSGEERNPRTFWNALLELESFREDWKIVK